MRLTLTSTLAAAALASAAAALKSSHGVLQGAIAREMRLKRTPTLTFKYDDTPERGERISRLLEEEE